MVFYLAALPNGSFELLKVIYRMFSDGELKGQHVPRSKKGTLAKPPHLKGSKFKCLRGIDGEEVCRLLRELQERSI